MDYFAKELLNKLPTQDPIAAAYEAQDVSRNVGFDFADFDSVVPRALDEIRETKEAYLEEGEAGREHFGDELADIMFSFVNLARHAGVKNLPSIDFFEAQAAALQEDTRPVNEIVDTIAGMIHQLSEVSKNNPEALVQEAETTFCDGVLMTAALAAREGYDSRAILTENVQKYLIRCEAIEHLAQDDKKSWADLAAGNEIIAYWKRAKSLLQ